MVLGPESGESEPGVADTPTGSSMQVRKRDGSAEPVDVNKIVKAVQRCSDGLSGVDPLRVATRTISGLVDGATTEELDALLPPPGGLTRSVAGLMKLSL